MTTIDAILVERVKAGAAFLDTVAPGWETRIDRDTLDLVDEMSCICGQVFADDSRDFYGDNRDQGGFVYAIMHLFSEARAWLEAVDGFDNRNRGFDWTIELGFDVEVPYYGYGQLQRAWTVLLNERLAEGVS